MEVTDMPYSFYGKGSRTFIKKNSTSRKFLDLIKENGGLTINEAKTLANPKTAEGSIWSLYKRDYIKRFPFYTIEGYIYFLDQKSGFDYGLKKGLIPGSIKILNGRIERNGAVSSLELRDIGLPQQEINWFFKKLVRNKLLKAAYFKNYYLVFYKSEKDYEKYIKTYQEYLEDLTKRFIKKAKRRGKELEELIAKYYYSLGFNVERNIWFTSPYKERIEIDVLATRPEINLAIAVECKNYEARCIGANIFLKIARIKSVIPRAIVHIYAKHISDKIISNRSFWRDARYRDVFFFSTKQIHAIHERLEEAIVKAS